MTPAQQPQAAPAATPAAAVARARQVVSAVADPGLRAALFGGPDAVPHRPSPRFDWIDTAGAVDADLLARTAATLRRLMATTAVLELERIDALPVAGDERSRVTDAVIRLVTARLAPVRRLSEPVLNAAIAMLAADVATIRRDAVDRGLLRRAPDGSVYEIV